MENRRKEKTPAWLSVKADALEGQNRVNAKEGRYNEPITESVKSSSIQDNKEVSIL